MALFLNYYGDLDENMMSPRDNAFLFFFFLMEKSRHEHAVGGWPFELVFQGVNSP